MKKSSLLIFLSVLCFTFIVGQTSNSARLLNSKVVFYDSSDFIPVYPKGPYHENEINRFITDYENTTNVDLYNLKLDVELYHLTYPFGAPGLGLTYSNTFTIDTLKANEIKKLDFKTCGVTLLGSYSAKYKISNFSNVILDSSEFRFAVSDTSFSKQFDQVPKLKTSVAYFVDSNLNLPGGTQSGDRIATLYELRQKRIYNDIPTSISVYISMDTSNVGVQIVPIVYELREDSITGSITIGNLLASAFTPKAITASDLGKDFTLTFDNGSALVNGLNEGKYAVGIEVINSFPSGKTIIIGSDSTGATLQPKGSSFIYFGHDMVWYRKDFSPAINFNYDPRGNKNPCTIVGLNKLEEKQITSVIVYPIPTSKVLTIESRAFIKNLEMFNLSGELIMNKTPLRKKLKINISSIKIGVYFLKLYLTDGTITTKKIILN